MCGIAGIFDRRSGAPVTLDRIESMCQSLSHRGPDDQGIHLDGSVGLGHRRLSVIDLAGGHQPMANEDDTLWITYNGEIYNYRELRSDLRDRHRFETQCDTEVIIHLFEEMGDAAFEQLNGIFAFALWDAPRRRLILARDRFGVKPLYYTITPDGRFAFASEIKALLTVDGVHPEVNPEALAEHFTFQNTFGEHTLFNNIYLLEPGTSLTVTQDRVVPHTFWKMRYQDTNGRTEEQCVSDLRDLFQKAVTRQLVSDVPVGGYLSGGMDSGSVAAVAAREIRPFHTFTCGFDTTGVSEFEQHFDERVEAELLAKQLDTQHHERHIFPGEMAEILPGLVWHLEDFRVGISYQIYAINELLSKYVTVVLSGVGGDELFAGYPWRYNKILGAKDRASFDDIYHAAWVRLLDDDGKRQLFSPELNARLSGFSSFDRFREVLSGVEYGDPLDRALHFDAKTFLHGLLVVEDKLSMAHGVETRLPFLDNELVDYVLGLPSGLKFRDGDIKVLLKKAMSGILPDETLNRRKQGFTPPDQTWYRGETLVYVKNLILGERARSRPFFNPDTIVQILDDHVSGASNHRFLLWSLMCFEWWNRIFIDGERPHPTSTLVERADALAITAG